MGIDRRALAAGAAAGFAAVVIGFGHDRSLPPIVLLAAGSAYTAATVWLLGRQRGALVALLVAAALNRYSAEIAGATFKPEHIVAPLAGLALLPDARVLVRRVDAVSALLLIWLAWSVVPGLLNAPDPGNSTRLWAMLALVSSGFFATVTTVRTAGRAHVFARAWLYVGISFGLFGIAEHLLYQGLGIDLGIQINPATGDPTVPGTFYEANLFGSATMMLALTGIALIAFSSRLRWPAWAAATVGTLAMQLSFTRTAWVAFVIGLLAIVVVRLLVAPHAAPAAQPARPAFAPLGAYLGVTILATLLLWGPFRGEPGQLMHAELFPTPTVDPARASATAAAPGGAPTPTPVPTLAPLVVGTPVAGHAWTPVVREEDIIGRVASIGNRDDSSVRLRIEFIRTALRDWREHPVVGLGIGSFGQTYISTSNDRAWLSMFAVRLLHDGGLIGITLFALPMLLLVWHTAQLARRPLGTETARLALALAVAVFAMFVAFLATEGLQLAWYWIAFGLFVACLRIALSQAPAGDG